MLAAKFLSGRSLRTVRLLLAFVAVYGAFASAARAQINTSINQSVWEMYYGINPSQVQASWLTNQLPAGTNPLLPNSQLQVSTFSSASGNVSLTFPTVAHKLYTAQATTSLNPVNWQNVSGSTVVGDGTNKTFTFAKSAGTYYHVLVQDQSTANDGVSDWAKSILGYTLGTSITSQTSYTAPTLATALSTQNTVTVNATDPTGSQPQSSTAAATNVAVITISRAGYQSFNAITVPLTVTGTAVAGVDYTALPSSVTFPAGVNTIPLNVTPLYNPAQFSTTTVIVTAQAGGGYALGSPASASIVLYPSVIPAGTGLTGSYFNGANTTYAPTPPTAANLGDGVATYSYNGSTHQAIITYTNAATQPSTPIAAGTVLNLQFITGNLSGGAFDTNYTVIFNAGSQCSVTVPGTNTAAGGTVVITPYNTPAGTRLDPTVDFVWNGTAPISGVAAASPFTARWTGQVLATFTEPYFFSVKSTQGCRLWVNNQKIIDQWVTQGVTDRISTAINLQAGVFYDIKLEYLSTSTTADEVHLQWYNNDMSEQVIPTANLYPNITGFGAAAAAAVTSSINTAYVLGTGVPFTYTITGSNGTTSVTASNLPAWLTLTGNTLSGTPPAVGTYQFTVTVTNSGGSSSSAVTLTVTDPPGNITREIWTGLAGANVYNIPTSTTPPTTTDATLTTLEDTATYANNTGERLRGYFTAPTTGNYYFWIAASNAAELWISDDNQKVNLIRRAYVTGPTGTASRTWGTQTNQQSLWLSLTAGQNYYFEVLHNTGSSGASSNLSVAWFLDPTGSSGGISNGAGPAQASVGGVVPAANLWPWDNPTTTNTAGSIYLANLAPAASLSVPTKASGGAYLSVNGSTGLLHLNYSGLTSGTLWRRVYTGPVGSPTLLFDLDAQDKNFPAQKTSDGGYTWTISNLSTLTSGAAYLTVATQSNPAGEITGSFALTAGSQTPPAVPSYPSFTDDHATVAGAARFLNQATFGASPSDIAYVQANGFRAWIDNQFTLAATTNTNYVLNHLSADPQNPYQSTLMFNSWWTNAVTAPDQLRQRIAFALSEIIVVSDNNSGINNLAEPQASYYDTLLNSSFTNYSTLLQNTTLSIAMGDYLNMLFNGPGNLLTGVHPNENYAREIMQLFSIGLYRLWPDGTLVLDTNGEPIPTYNQTQITGMAAVMTGWGWGQAAQSNGRLPTNFGSVADWLDPMVLDPNQHSLVAKPILDNAVLPASTFTSSSTTATGNPIVVQTMDPVLGQGHLVNTTVTNAYDLNGLIDLQAALSLLSNHANVGPFFCRQLIQRLVESNPSTAYVYRVVRAFNGVQNVDGVQTGVVGDLKDTIRAILLDPEARNSSAAASSTTFGKQREPLLRITGPARAFPVTGIANSTYRELGGQPILVTTPSAHRLVNNDVIQLDTIVDAGSNPPPSQGYSVANTTPSYTVATTTATITAPGYQTGDKVNIQFTSGTLGTTSPYNTVQQYTVGSATSTTFTVPLAANFNGASGNAFTPNNFTISNPQLATGSFSNTGTTVTVSSSGHNAGDQIYLEFTGGTGNISGGTYNGVYTIATSTGSQFTVTLASAPSTNTSGTALWPQFNGGYTVTTSAGTSTVTFQTSGANNLDAGNSVWIDILVGNTPTALPTGLYTVTDTSATKSSLAPNEFTITVNSTLTTGTQSTNGYAAYPLNVSNWTRNGTATIDLGTYNLGYTTQFIQTPLDSPTVFNYYYPNYAFPGAIANAGLTTPEFELTNASNTMTLTNSISAGIVNAGNTNGYTSFSSGGGSIVMDLGPYMTQAQTADASTGIQALVGTLGALLTGGNTFAASPQSASNLAITTFVANDTNFPLSSPPTNVQMSNRVRAIVQLILTSAEYAIQK